MGKKKAAEPVVKVHKKSTQRDLTVYTMDATLQRMVKAKQKRTSLLENK